MNTFTTITKALIKIVSNAAIVILSIMSISSLILLLLQIDITNVIPNSADITFSAYDVWGGVNAFAVTFVAGNTLMTYGLIKFKKFVSRVNQENLITDETALFLKKGAILMTIVGLLQGITEFIIDPHTIVLNVALAGWLFIASLAVSYIKKHREEKKLA